MNLNMYGPLCTQYYELDKPTAPSAALAFYLQFCRPETLVLEVMCGTGRFLLPIQEKGFSIEGVDASADMLSVCRKKAEERGLNVTLYEQFAHELALPKLYDLIIIPAASFGLIIDSVEIDESLQRLADHLRPGGRLVIEVEPPENRPSSLGQVTASMREYPDGRRLILTSFTVSYDAAAQVSRSMNRYDLTQSGRLLETEYEDFSVRYHEQESFSARLKRAGFAVQAMSTNEEALVFDCQ